jgi:ATP-dependent exoDNAse (exonuclease V) beta subunit
MLLSQRNTHPRDKNIQFFEEGHKYVILSDSTSTYTSVTTWNHSHFPKFDADNIIKNMMKSKGWKQGHKYWGLTAQEIKEMWSSNTQASAGTALHYEIECFMNSGLYTNADLYMKSTTNINTQLEWQYFLNFLKDYPHLKPYRTEWTIYNEDLKIAGSIDMVYENQDGSLSIYDWKRCKNITRINTFNKFALNPIINHFPDSNFWHYALQLNTYKAILEDKYHVKVSELFLVRLHPDAEEENYELIQIPLLNKEIAELFLERKKEIKTI